MTKKLDEISIGIDVGHSRVKYGYALASKPEEHFIDSFPTVVIDYFSHRSPEEKEKIDRYSTIELNGKKHIYGETARIQGNISTFIGQTKDWINSTEHDVLILGAWKNIHDKLDKDIYIKKYKVTLGLPTKYFASQKDVLLERLKAIIPPLLNKDQEVDFYIKAQSEAPLYSVLFNKDGTRNENRNLRYENYGVIEVGHYTTDYTLVYKGEIVDKHSESSEGGKIVHDFVANKLSAKYSADLGDIIEQAVERGSFYYDGSEQDVSSMVEEGAKKLLNSVLEKSKEVFGKHEKFLHGIIVAGGGAPLIIDGLKEMYKNNIVEVKSPRNAVVESFIRSGLFLIRFERNEKKEKEVKAKN